VFQYRGWSKNLIVRKSKLAGFILNHNWRIHASNFENISGVLELATLWATKCASKGHVWGHPSTQVNKTKLERVHKRALRFVYGRHTHEQNKTQLLNVDQQLRYNDLTFFRKCLDGDTDMDATARITTGRTMRNSNGEHRLIPPKVRTDLGIHSFSFRLATQWNSLPSDLKSCPASHFPKMCRTYVMSV